MRGRSVGVGELAGWGFVLAAAALTLSACDRAETPPAPATPAPAAKHRFPDGRFFADSANWNDAAWSVESDADASTPAADAPDAAFRAVQQAVPGSREARPLRVSIRGHLHYVRDDQRKSDYVLPLKSLGKMVRFSEVEELCTGLFEDWNKSVRDGQKTRWRRPARTVAGPARWFGRSVGVVPSSSVTEYHAWYAWVVEDEVVPLTYVAEFSAPAGDHVSDEIHDAAANEFMRSIRRSGRSARR